MNGHPAIADARFALGQGVALKRCAMVVLDYNGRVALCEICACAGVNSGAAECLPRLPIRPACA